MRMPRSLQGRLLVLVLGLVAGVWAATAAMTWIDVRHELDELLDSHLAQAAALLVVQQVREIDDDDHQIDAPSLHRYAPKVAFQVFHEGRLALRSANAPAGPMAGAGDDFQSGFRTVQIDGTAWRVFAARGGERDVQVYVGEQVESRSAILWAVLRSVLWPMLVALPLLGLAAWWAVHRGVAPLRSLGRTLAARRPQALEPVAVAGAPSEMTPMLDALNGLFERIATLLDSERRFTADAAHELRTPIAAIRAQAQVALAESDDALRKHALQSTLEGCDRATRLVEQLLTLSRLEAGATSMATPLDLGALVRGVVAEVALRAVLKQQTIEVDAPEPCRVAGDATLLAVLVRNLVDNAIRYSPPRAAVRVGVAAQGAQVRLRVEDSGPGMTEQDSARLGERFFRVLGTGEGGSGLGWSIVRRIASAQGAAIHVGRSPGLGGLAVQVDWPAR
ncbi:MAG: sensor histidine kinase N-terminal domain-containing protein [Betaproteobacteria bacterium]|nr:sensor histidine kinase N-terminal domain-containing protein [Betaproteobacteria bacterium]